MPAASSAARVTALASAVFLAGCSVIGIETVEQPSYRVVDHVGTVEIREYGPRIVAETVVAGDEMDARSAGFRKIAGYIFGGNRASRKIDMTAPVAQSAAASEKIAMTSPVAQDKAEGGWRIRFFMPASATMATLPQPDDPDVRLVEVPGETVAALRFTGARDGSAVTGRTRELIGALSNSRWQPAGSPVAWFYDPPWTIPFLRRNEVAIPVRPR